jgi:peptidoglycan hydrolase-like protein with peptidoglycan-binding domain
MRTAGSNETSGRGRWARVGRCVCRALLGLAVWPLAQPTPSTAAGATAAEPGLRWESSAGKATKTQRQRRRSRERGQTVPTPERIKEIQAALARAGFYQREITGTWDDYSKEALLKFQQAHGLKPTGKLDALSLQKLGLGSEIAGLAPPRSPAETAASSEKKSGTPD